MNAAFNGMKWAAIGALAGSAIFPGVGTIIGGIGGAILGAILGWIGGDKIAQAVDKMGVWLSKKWDEWVIVPLKTAWDAVVPAWLQDISFEWTDIFPDALTKLFNGEYFTVEFPTFTWTDLFPQFLQDLFAAGKTELDKTTFEWKDLMPPFIKNFFAGTYEKEGTFEWKQLLPPFITKIIGVAETAWAKTEFTWKSLLPTFLTKIWDNDYIQPKEAFEWKHLVPGFIRKIIDAGSAAGTTETGEFDWTRLLPDWMKSAWGSVKAKGLEKLKEGETAEGFDWSRLLPDWMIGAWKSTGGLIKQSYFGWKNLFPEWLQPYFTTAEGAVSKVLDKAAKAFDWKTLLPTFIQDFITDPTKITKEGYKFTWKNLLPEFIVNMIGAGKDKIEKLTGISNIGQAIIDQFKVVVAGILKILPFSKSEAEISAEKDIVKKTEEFGDVGKKKVSGARASLVKMGALKLSSGFIGDDDNLNIKQLKTALESATTEDGKRQTLHKQLSMLVGDERIAEADRLKLSAMLANTKMMKKGGIVGMSPFAKGSLGKAMGLESGGLFTLSQGEMVLDNQAAQTFLKAAQLLTGSRAIEQAKGGGAPIVVNNNNVDNSQTNSSSQATTLRVPESVRSGEPTMTLALNSMSQ